VFKSRLPGPSSRHRLLPAPEMLATGKYLCPQLWGCQTLFPRPAACPCWARSKMYENTFLIISLKRLRNKVVLFFFYNPSKKKVHISARAQN